MKIAVNILDVPTNSKSYISFAPEDIERARAIYENNNDDISALANAYPEFDGYSRWCDLSIPHYRVMLARTLTVAAYMAANAHTDHDRATTATNLTILCFIFTLERLSGSEIEYMLITRMTPTHFTFSYTASLPIEYPKPLPKNGAPVIDEESAQSPDWDIIEGEGDDDDQD